MISFLFTVAAAPLPTARPRLTHTTVSASSVNPEIALTFPDHSYSHSFV